MVEAAGAAARYGLPRDTLVVSGPDRKTWLDGLVTCEVAAVAPGHAGYGLLLTKQGKIVSDVFLADDGRQLFIGVAPGKGPAVRELLDRYLVMEDAELAETSTPAAWRLVKTEGEAPDAAWARGRLKLGTLERELEVGALTTSSAGPHELTALLAAHGLGTFGVDFGERDNPHEASLDRIAVSWTKGCYLGQEVVCMQDMRGKVKRRLVALEGDAALLALRPTEAEPANVLGPDGAVFGQVTSVHAGPSGGARLLATLTSAALESQTSLTVQGQAVRVVEAAGPLLS